MRAPAPSSLPHTWRQRPSHQLVEGPCCLPQRAPAPAGAAVHDSAGSTVAKLRPAAPGVSLRPVGPRGRRGRADRPRRARTSVRTASIHSRSSPHRRRGARPRPSIRALNPKVQRLERRDGGRGEGAGQGGLLVAFFGNIFLGFCWGRAAPTALEKGVRGYMKSFSALPRPSLCWSHPPLCILAEI